MTRITRFGGTAGASTKLGQTTINFGAVAVNTTIFTINDAGVTSGAKVVSELAYVAASGRDLDELEMDSMTLKAGQTLSGAFQLIATPLFGEVSDGFVVNYYVG